MGKGRGQNKTGRSERAPRFVQLEYWLLEDPNFLALSPNAKVVMIYMAKRINGSNNGKIGFGLRSGCPVIVNAKDSVEKTFGMSRDQIRRALDELDGAGFIVCTKPATFHQKRLTREWRLTWLPSGAGSERPATKEFASRTPDENLKPRRAGATNKPLQTRQCAYDSEPFDPKEHYRRASAPIAQSDRRTSASHLITMGYGGTVIPYPGVKTA